MRAPLHAEALIPVAVFAFLLGFSHSLGDILVLVVLLIPFASLGGMHALEKTLE